MFYDLHQIVRGVHVEVAADTLHLALPLRVNCDVDSGGSVPLDGEMSRVNDKEHAGFHDLNVSKSDRSFVQSGQLDAVYFRVSLSHQVDLQICM